MNIALLRVFMFTFLPLLVAGAHWALDKSARSRERRLELFWIYLTGLGVAGSGLSGFFGHVFISDLVAESIGWPGGNPFQLEVGFTNLALGVLGIVAMGRRDGFREATVIAVTVFGVGATIVHALDILETGNLAPGNTIQNVSNLFRPALLIGFLAAMRRVERVSSAERDASQFMAWHMPRVQGAGFMAGAVTTGFGVGFAVGWPGIGTAIGILAGALLVVWVVSRPGQDPSTSSA